MSNSTKKLVTERAKTFFTEALKQAPALLAHRLGMESQDYTPAIGRASAFWFAAQKLFLTSQDQAQMQNENTDTAEMLLDHLYGVLDLIRRCEHTLSTLGIQVPSQHKFQALAQRVLEQLGQHEIDLHESRQSLSVDIEGNTEVERAALTPQDLLGSVEDVEQSFSRFLESREKVLAAKLQYLPDTKLVKILGFESQSSFSLSEPMRDALQRFVHLQTVFDSVKKAPQSEAAQAAYKVLCPELNQLIQIQSDSGILGKGYFIAVHILFLRVLQWGARYEAQFDIDQIPLQDLVKACLELGFIQSTSQGNLVMTLNTRAYYIGQGILLLVEQDLHQLWPDYLAFFEQSDLDLPSLARMASQDRLLVSAPGEESVAQVGITTDVLRAMNKYIHIQWFDYFESPKDRDALKKSQLKQLQTAFVLTSSLEDANLLALQLFLTLSEVGQDWRDMFGFLATIKSVFRRKNIKLVWHEDTSPFWTLKLRTHLNDPWQNKPFPKAKQIVKLLKRFDF